MSAIDTLIEHNSAPYPGNWKLTAEAKSELSTLRAERDGLLDTVASLERAAVKDIEALVALHKDATAYRTLAQEMAEALKAIEAHYHVSPLLSCPCHNLLAQALLNYRTYEQTKVPPAS